MNSPTTQDLFERIDEAEFHFKKMKRAKKRQFQNYYFHACLNALYVCWKYIELLYPIFAKQNKKNSLIQYWIDYGSIRGTDVHRTSRKIRKQYNMPKKIQEVNKLREQDAYYFVHGDARELKQELTNLIKLFKNAR